jgi:hypothetical protein
MIVSLILRLSRIDIILNLPITLSLRISSSRFASLSLSKINFDILRHFEISSHP